MKPSRITYDTVRRLALALPGVEESTSYGTPALKVNGKLFVRWRNEVDPDTIVLKMTFEQREGLMADDPEAYFITDHYLNYPWVLVRLSKVTHDALRELLHIGHQNASSSKRSKSKHTKSRR
jgi:hypothetical protein